MASFCTFPWLLRTHIVRAEQLIACTQYIRFVKTSHKPVHVYKDYKAGRSTTDTRSLCTQMTSDTANRIIWLKTCVNSKDTSFQVVSWLYAETCAKRGEGMGGVPPPTVIFLGHT